MNAINKGKISKIIYDKGELKVCIRLDLTTKIVDEDYNIYINGQDKQAILLRCDNEYSLKLRGAAESLIGKKLNFELDKDFKSIEKIEIDYEG